MFANSSTSYSKRKEMITGAGEIEHLPFLAVISHLLCSKIIHSSPCRVILSCVVLGCHTLSSVDRFLEGHNLLLCTQAMLWYDQHLATPAQVNLVSCLSARQCLLSAAFMDCRYTCCQYTSSLLTISTAQQNDEQGQAALCAPTSR